MFINILLGIIFSILRFKRGVIYFLVILHLSISSVYDGRCCLVATIVCYGNEEQQRSPFNIINSVSKSLVLQVQKSKNKQQNIQMSYTRNISSIVGK